jgi:hypothetical protein
MYILNDFARTFGVYLNSSEQFGLVIFGIGVAFFFTARFIYRVS